MRPIADLIAAIRAEAIRAEFPVDLPVYERAGKDPATPILFAGALDARVCVFGRDLGKDEVAAGEPLIGVGGRLVRVGLYQAARGEPPKPGDKRVEEALGLALLTNTVPYKPPGNKAYAEKVKERFRPFVAELIVDHWAGDRVITLGTEAYQWFARYADPVAASDFWRRDDRYEADLPVVVRVETREKAVAVLPLPHPSPLNRRWYGLFPGLLGQRLASIGG